MENIKLSFCTVCMNRTHHLKETLLRNLKDNSTFKNLEFVLLDYDSKDDMEDWVKSNFGDYINTCRLLYYKSPQHDKFNMAHSKNMVSRLASGDVICIIDADNFTGPGYAQYVHKVFSEKRNVFITTAGKRRTRNLVDVLGRVCFWKNDFTTIKGFDEFMNSYGYDDIDFANRLEMLGRKRVILKSQKYLKAIRHDMNERIKNQKIFSEFKFLFVAYNSPAESELIYMFKDGSFSIGTVTDNAILTSYKMNNANKVFKDQEAFSLQQLDWTKGVYKVDKSKIILENDDNFNWVGNIDHPEMKRININDERTYYRVENNEDIRNAIYLYSVLSNLNKTKFNLKNKDTVVNRDGFGIGNFYCNFDTSNLNALL